MNLHYAVLLILIPSAVLIVAIIAFLRGVKASKNKDTQGVVFLSHTEAIRRLPEYAKARKIYHAFVAVMLAVFGIGVVACGWIASRPFSVSVQNNEVKNRDIMICVDVSGSMSGTMGENFSTVASDFSNLAKDLEGQRVGITIFSDSSAMILPLSNDYILLSDTLQEMSSSISNFSSALPYHKATDSEGTNSLTLGGNSLIGEGAISCVKNMRPEENRARSQSVILFTDNWADGEISLTQAANYARKYDITFYGIDYSGSSVKYSETSQEYKHAMLSTGGAYYTFADDKSKIDKIAGKIMEQESSSNEATSKIIQTDTPELAIGLCIFAITVFLIAAWSLRI